MQLQTIYSSKIHLKVNQEFQSEKTIKVYVMMMFFNQGLIILVIFNK